MSAPGFPPDDAAIYGVRRLTAELRALLEGEFADIWVRGEISSLSAPSSGHLYFSLKEQDAVIRCAFFANRRRAARTDCAPQNGMQVLLRAQISLYEARGDLQLIVTYMEDAGEGALRREFAQRKRKLEAEGLFAARAKKPLPRMPRSVGVVTSAAGAALQDIRVSMRRRWPVARLVVYPCAVQGAGAPAEIVEMLELANARAEVDTLIVARGGGSAEDLQAFNSEEVARAIFRSKLPVVSAIGHEIDFSIADFTADARAPTPTAAAQIAAPDAAALQNEFSHAHRNLQRHMQWRIDSLARRVDHAANALARPARRIDSALQTRRELTAALRHCMRAQLDARRLRLQEFRARLQHCSPLLQLAGARRRLQDARKSLLAAPRLPARLQRVELLAQKLQLLGPAQTLARGYAVLRTPQGKVVFDSASAKRAQKLHARVARGSFGVSVEEIFAEE